MSGTPSGLEPDAGLRTRGAACRGKVRDHSPAISPGKPHRHSESPDRPHHEAAKSLGLASSGPLGAAVRAVALLALRTFRSPCSRVVALDAPAQGPVTTRRSPCVLQVREEPQVIDSHTRFDMALVIDSHPVRDRPVNGRPRCSVRRRGSTDTAGLVPAHLRIPVAAHGVGADVTGRAPAARLDLVGRDRTLSDAERDDDAHQKGGASSALRPN